MRWALVGASTIAEQHMINAIRATGGIVAALISTTDGRARDFSARNGIPAYGTSLETILNDPSIGAVYISSTNEKHHPQALAAIAADKHVLCEKPLAMTTEEAAEMCAQPKLRASLLPPTTTCAVPEATARCAT